VAGGGGGAGGAAAISGEEARGSGHGRIVWGGVSMSATLPAQGGAL